MPLQRVEIRVSTLLRWLKPSRARAGAAAGRAWRIGDRPKCSGVRRVMAVAAPGSTARA